MMMPNTANPNLAVNDCVSVSPTTGSNHPASANRIPTSFICSSMRDFRLLCGLHALYPEETNRRKKKQCQTDEHDDHAQARKARGKGGKTCQRCAQIRSLLWSSSHQCLLLFLMR